MEGYKGNFILTGADTDSIAICKKNGTLITEKEREDILKEINSLFPERIKFEDDGYYDSVIVVKAKNYLMKKGDKITMKGSALKATMKEKALRDFLKQSLDLLMNHNIDALYDLYMDYVDSIVYLKDIAPWCSKKTITNAVLTSQRANETRIKDAVKGINVQEGDKIQVFFKSDTEVCLLENFDGKFDSDKLYEKLYKTLSIFSTILEKEMGFEDKIIKKTGEVVKVPVWKKKFLNFKLKGNKEILETL